MAQDEELYRLSIKREMAYKHRMSLFQAKEAAWNKFSEFRDEMKTRRSKLRNKIIRSRKIEKRISQNELCAYDYHTYEESEDILIGSCSKKDQSSYLKREYNRLKTEHLSIHRASIHAQIAHDKVTLEYNRRFAELVGVPDYYLDSIEITQSSDNCTHVFFGGLDEPNGHGHGHCVIDELGRLTYSRPPLSPHGPQNYIKDCESIDPRIYHGMDMVVSTAPDIEGIELDNNYSYGAHLVSATSD